MKIDSHKLDLVLARRCMSRSDLRKGTSPQTLVRISKGLEVTTKTVGRIASALGVDVAEILSQGGAINEITDD